jgi:hypothetical protein
MRALFSSENQIYPYLTQENPGRWTGQLLWFTIILSNYIALQDPIFLPLLLKVVDQSSGFVHEQL